MDDVLHEKQPDVISSMGPYVETWEESQRTWLDAIEHEKLLMVFLFALISIVAIFLIFCIFYMIVVEKTKDIGIIKSVGATSQRALRESSWDMGWRSACWAGAWACWPAT